MEQFRLINRQFIKCVDSSKPRYTSITYSKIPNIPYNLIFTIQFNNFSILIAIISCDYFNLLLTNILVTSQYQPRLLSISNVFSRWISQSDCNIHIKLNMYIFRRIYVYIRLKIKPNSVRIRSLSWQFFFLPRETGNIEHKR